MHLFVCEVVWVSVSIYISPTNTIYLFIPLNTQKIYKRKAKTLKSSTGVIQPYHEHN